VFEIAPLIIMLMSSLKSNVDIYAHPLGVPRHARLDTFTTAWQGPPGQSSLGTYFVNSIEAALLSILLGVGGGTLAGYALVRWQSRWAGALHRMFIVLLSVPLLATVIPIFVLLGNLGLRDSVVGLALVYGAFIVPTAAVLMRSFFVSVPHDLVDAALVDGCSERRAFFGIVLPLSRGALVGVTIINLIWVWSELLFAIVLLNTPESKTLPVGLLGFQGQYFTDVGVQSAALLMATMPIVLVFLIFQRHIAKGLTLGAIR
jgi:ABC-type glycerol-3-phosphate transport system permease component